MMNASVLNKCALALAAASLPLWALAQAVTPDAGALQHEIEHDLERMADVNFWRENGGVEGAPLLSLPSNGG